METGGNLITILESVFGPVVGTLLLMAFGLYKWYKTATNAESKAQQETREHLDEAQKALFSQLQSEIEQLLAAKLELRRQRDREYRWSVWHRALADAHHREAREIWHAYNSVVQKARMLCPDHADAFPPYPEPHDLENIPTRGAQRPTDME